MPQHKARKKGAQDDAPGHDDPAPAPAFSPQHLTYIQVLLETIMDPRMSAKALGLLAYGLARQTIPQDRLPGGWQFHQSEFAQNFKDGVESIRTGLQELQDLGYADYQLNPRQVGRLQGGNYVFHASSPSTPVWPPHRTTTGTRSGQAAPGKTATGKTERGKSPSIQLKPPARGAGRVQGGGDHPTAPDANSPEHGTQREDRPGRPDKKAAADKTTIHSKLQTLLTRTQLSADSEDGQTLINSVEVALQGSHASEVVTAMTRALSPQVRNPAAYLTQILSQLGQQAAPPPRAQDLDVGALRDRLLDRQLRLSSGVTASVQDVLDSPWPRVLFEDGTELDLSKLGDYEVVE